MKQDIHGMPETLVKHYLKAVDYLHREVDLSDLQLAKGLLLKEILKKVDSLQHCIKRIEEDYELKDIETVNLKKAGGFGNIAVREYIEITGK